MKYIKECFIWFLVFSILCFGLTSCNKTETESDIPSSSDASSELTPSIEDNSSLDFTESDVIESVPTASVESNEPIEESNESKKENPVEHMVIRVADYGAKGDGKTDDFQALSKAIQAAKDANSLKTTIEFAPNSVYLIKNNNSSSVALDFTGLRNTTIKGNKSTIKISGFNKYFTTLGSKNLTIDGLNFNYAEKVYTMSDILDVDIENMTITIKSKDSLGINSNWSTTFNNNFGIIKEETDGRKYIFYQNIEVIDAARHIYKLTVREYDGQTIPNMQLLKEKGYQLITPIPDVGQIESSAMTVHNSEDFVFQNCNIYAASFMIFSVRNNTGKIQFINTNVIPEPGSDGAMVSWRDTFHCKENRAQIIWKNCTLKGSFDDVFNISCTRNIITKIVSSTEIIMNCPLLGGSYPMDLEVGDTVTIYNHKNGRSSGSTKIKKIVSQGGSETRIVLEDKMHNLAIGNTVAVDSLSAPGSVVDNCDINGSIRIQTSVSFLNTSFKLWHGWVQNAAWAEGPLPNNVMFKNCKFKGYDESKAYVTVGTETESGVTPKYVAKNIVFEDCDIGVDKIKVTAGSDVKIVKNGNVVHTF